MLISNGSKDSANEPGDTGVAQGVDGTEANIPLLEESCDSPRISSQEEEGSPDLTDEVVKWRSDNLLTDNTDFAHFFLNLEEAHSNAGHAVATSWSKARSWAGPEMINDASRVSRIQVLGRGKKEDLFLEADHAAALEAAGYTDNEGDDSERVLERRRLRLSLYEEGKASRSLDEPNHTSLPGRHR